jgi:hypothetical protein
MKTNIPISNQLISCLVPERRVSQDFVEDENLSVICTFYFLECNKQMCVDALPGTFTYNLVI